LILAAGRVAWRGLLRFFDHNGPDRAAAVAYYTLLSLLPLLIFLISVGVAVAGSFDAAYRGTLSLFAGLFAHMDERAIQALRELVERAVRFQWPGILLLAWTSKRIYSSLFAALETVFGVPARGFAKGNLTALAMVMVTGVALLATMALAPFVAGAEGLLRRYAPAEAAAAFRGLAAPFLAHGLPVLVTGTFFFVLYRVAPGRAVPVRHAALGALLATVLWEAAKAGFAYYVRNLARYAGLYGAFEAVIVLGLWLELSVSIILYCGEVVALLVPQRGAPAAESHIPVDTPGVQE
jgi:membrane protein